jgi:hypothetical protein
MGMNNPMSKPETSIVYVSKKDVRKQEVLTVCIGDINGDGKKEIVFGGGSNEANGNLIYAISNISSPSTFLLEKEIPGGYLKQGICFDIDNDQKDEIICGNKRGKLFYLDLEGNNYQIKDLHAFDEISDSGVNIIEDIQIINFEGIVHIFSCSLDGTLNIIGMHEGNKIFDVVKKFDFPIYSLNPFVINNRLHLILGGEGNISIHEVDRENKLLSIWNSGLEDFKQFKNGLQVDVKDRIYSILTLENGSGSIKFACGFRSGKLKILQYSTELVELSENNFDRSIYDITSDDIDSCGKKEIIVAGEMHNDNGDIGFIKIYKIQNDNLIPLCGTTYKKRILSIQSFLDISSNNRYLFASGIGEALISFKIVNLEEIFGLVSSLGLQISENPGKYCFFLGAGFSIPCFPLADDLSHTLISKSGVSREAIFDYLKNNEKAKKILEDAITPQDRIPLEAVLFWYKNHRDREPMLQLLSNIFDNNSIAIPEHIDILAKLLNTPAVNYVFSVNYDLLLERAASQIESLVYDSDFTSINICHKNVIMKLHGSITKPASIEGSLDEVGEFKGNKKTTLDFIFNGHAIIFVGYSCRDPDIFPALKEVVKKYGTSCYFVDPTELSEEAKEILDVSGKGDIRSRHFQITSDSFFNYLIGKMDIGKDDVVNHNANGVK